jgi:hypothetical protein
MPTIAFNPALFKVVKRLIKLGGEAEAIGRALKDIAITMGAEDYGRMVAEFELGTKRDSKSNGSTEKPTP